MKEQIQINTEEELDNLHFEGKTDLFKYEDKTVDRVDLGKSYQSIILIIKRISDNKYFKLEYDEGSYSDLSYNNFPIEGVEVFPETITKVIYK